MTQDTQLTVPERDELERLEDDDRVDRMRDALLEALHAFDVATGRQFDDEYVEIVTTSARAAVLDALDAASAHFIGRGAVDVACRRKVDRNLAWERIVEARRNGGQS